jgi:uncharacterized HAD superfamily protein
MPSSLAPIYNKPLPSSQVQMPLFTLPPAPIRLLLDLDGTLLYNACSLVLSRVLGTPLPDGPPSTWLKSNFLATIGISIHDFWATFSAHQDEIYSKAIPQPGAIDCVQRLKAAGAYIAVVTARRASAKEVTRYWLQQWQVPYDALEMEQDNKLPAAQRYSLNWAIEDDKLVATSLARVMRVILISPITPKRHSFHARIKLVAGWHDVYRLITE